MHRIFLIPELVYNVCDIISSLYEDILIDPDEADAAFRVDLASFARTCKAISGPANDVLWKKLDSVVVLLKLLPVRQTSDLFGRGKTLELTREATLNDWDRISHHARRVQILSQDTTTPGYQFRIGTKLQNALIARTSVSPLFPNLRCLEWHYEETWEWAILVLLSRTIDVVEIDEEAASPASFSLLLNQIAETCKEATYFLLYSKLVEEACVERSLLHCFTRLTRLEHLNFPNRITEEILLQLSRLTALNTLEIGHNTSGLPHWTTSDTAVPNPSFSSLRLMLLGVMSAEKAIAFTRGMTGPIARLDMAMESITGIEDWMDIVQQQYKSSLQSLTIAWATATAEGTHEWDLRTILPFIASMSGLRDLQIQFPGRILLDDTMLIQMSNSLPLLQLLRIRSSPNTARVKPDITLDGMLHCLRACPNMKTLSIGLNALNPIAINDPPISKLLVLELGLAPIDNPQKVAEIFSQALPSLAVLEWEPEILSEGEWSDIDQPRKGSFHDHWTVVREWLPTLQRIRKQERMNAEVRAAQLKYAAQQVPST